MKTVLITGASGGIGLETAKALAQDGAHVVIGARDPVRGQAAVDAIRARGQSAELLVIDLASMASIRDAARQWLSTHSTLDVLINNAGCATARREVTPDGIERTWETNFLGGFLLTELLRPALKRAPAPRVVNVSSGAHATAQINWDDLGYEHGFSGFRSYAQSKLAQILFTRELARREPAIATNAVHPGAIATGIWRATPAPIRAVLGVVLPSPSKGAKPVIRLAVGADVEGVSGQYFDKLRRATPSPAARNDADAARLWDIAERAITV
ncbi:MAG TPA: SDR family oxidoreductase [Gemmatimonadaceae bacterium]|jgi:retinol dehydrogenase-12|nr:SDR family oxidoreductase [Gemmatimonadaceae bacterium]